MGRFFDVNNSVWSFVGKIFDAFVLHLMWVLCCLPVVTAGPSTAALYYALIKDVRDEEGHYVRAFFKSFRTNLRQGMIIGIPDTALGVLFFFMLRFYLFLPGDAVGSPAANYLVLLPVIPYIFLNRYLFPYLGIFSDTVPNLVKGSFYMMMRNFGKTLVMSALTVGFYFLVVYFELWPILIFGYGIPAYFNSWLLSKAFDPLIRRIRQKEEEKMGTEAESL